MDQLVLGFQDVSSTEIQVGVKYGDFSSVDEMSSVYGMLSHSHNTINPSVAVLTHLAMLYHVIYRAA